VIFTPTAVVNRIEYDSLGKIRQQTTSPQVELGWKTGMSLFDDMVLLVARLQFSEVGFASSIQPACFASLFAPQMTNAFWNELVDILSGGNPEMRVMTDSEGGARCGWYNMGFNGGEAMWQYCCYWEGDPEPICSQDRRLEGGDIDVIINRVQLDSSYPTPFKYARMLNVTIPRKRR